MTRLSDYTTEELERLTTLTFDTMRPGEYVAPRPMVAQLCDVIPPSIRQSVGFKLSSGEIAGFDGSVAPHTTAAQSYALRRRVTSFTDATELDPTQAEMLAELARRKAPVFKVGELVMCGGEISKVVPVPEKFCNDAWANERQIVWMEGDPNSALGWEYAEKVRPATDAETAAYHRAHCQPKAAPAKPEVNRVYVRKDGVGLGYRYRWNGEQWERQCMTEPWRDWKGRWVTGIFNDRCQERWEEGGFVPEPAPVVISNATHAGQWVTRLEGDRCQILKNAMIDDYVSLVDKDGDIIHVYPPSTLTIIDPPVWPK